MDIKYFKTDDSIFMIYTFIQPIIFIIFFFYHLNNMLAFLFSYLC